MKGVYIVTLSVNDDQLQDFIDKKPVTVTSANDGENHILVPLVKKRFQTKYFKNLMKNRSTEFKPDMYEDQIFYLSKNPKGSGFLDTVRSIAGNRGVQRAIANVAGNQISRLTGSETAGNAFKSIAQSGLSSFANNESAKDAALKAGLAGASSAIDSYAKQGSGRMKKGGNLIGNLRSKIGAGKNQPYGLGGDISNPAQPWSDVNQRMAYVRMHKKTGGSFKSL